MFIPFNNSLNIGKFLDIETQFSNLKHYGGNGQFSRHVESWFNQYLDVNTLLTASCTQAMELACALLNVGKNDEIIMPSFNFTSAPAVISLFGATPVLVDISPFDLNINTALIESAISEKTRAIFVLNYAGIPCDYREINRIAQKYSLPVWEDNAHGLGAKLHGRPLGTFGDLSFHSFHYTKNIHCGEGGSLSLKNNELIHKAEIFREKGTNRASYLRGEIDKYSWYDKGGSFLLSDILSLILSSQLENIDGILNDRKNTWYFFLSHLSEWAERNNFAVPFVPEGLIPSAHIFYLWSIDANQSRNLIMHLRRKGIEAMQHYQSLSQSQGYKQYGEHGDDSFEVSEIVAKGIVRLPLWFGMTQEEREFIVDGVLSFNK